MKRRTLKVEEFADVHSGGTPSTSNGGFWDGGIPWITPKDLASYEARYIASGERDISEEGLRSSSARLLPEETVLLTTRAPIGYVALAANQLATNQGFKNLVCKRDLAVPPFVYYLLKHNTALLESHATGATFKELSGSRLKAIEFQLPDTDTQQRIADILSAYDDLIENNRRRMALLEDAARELYREWFVRLRFPGHEHTRITNGVPEGWERTRIGDVAQCIGGGTPSTSVPGYWEDGDVTWVTPTDVTRNRHFILLDSAKKITTAGLQSSSATLIPPHAVLMTSRASVGFFAFVGREVCTNQGFISIVPADAILSPYFLFHLSERVEEIRAMGSGSTYPEVSRGKFRELEVMLPKNSLTSALGDYTTEILNQIRVLKQQNEKLRAARDLLLPRLMSGQITV